MGNNEHQPLYGLQKLTIGFVSVILGFTLVTTTNSQVKADGNDTSTTQTNSDSPTSTTSGNTVTLRHGDDSTASSPVTSAASSSTINSAASSTSLPAEASTASSQATNSQAVSSNSIHATSNSAENVASSNEADSTYSATAGYQTSRETAYANVAKLLPTGTVTTIVNEGNTINTSDPLYQDQVLAAVPVDNSNHFIIDASSDPQAATGLVVAFTDGRIRKYDLAYQATTSDNLLEYQLSNGLHYTPLQSANVDSTITNDLVQTLNQVDLFSNEMKTKLGVTTDNQIRDLYLTNSFNQVKGELSTLVPALLANSSTGKTVSDPNTVAQKIKDNKLAVMLGLSYINRLYNISFGQYNILSLMMFRPDFFGAQMDGLDWLIKIGSLSANELKVGNNFSTFNSVLAPTLHVPALVPFLNQTRQELAPGVDAETWFRSNTGVYIYEASSKEPALQNNPQANVHIYHRLSTTANLRYRNFILPLLNMKDNDMYIVTTIATTTFGMPARYINQNLRTTNPTLYQQKLQQFDQSIQTYADDWANYFDFWYRMTNDQGKQLLLTSNIPVWDSYLLQDSSVQHGQYWADKYNTSVPAIAEFFGPVGDMYRSNGSAAYASGSYVHFVAFRPLDVPGTSTLTHEMTHNFDGKIYFDGYGRRDSMGPEAFAQGLLQSTFPANPNYYGLNLAFDYSAIPNKTTNDSPTQFKTPDDVGNFMHGIFDVTYLLDYAEAQSMLSKSNADKELVYNQITYDPTQKADVITAIDDSTAAKLNNLDSLIDNNIIAKRAYAAGSGRTYGKNAYAHVSLYAPDYAGVENPDGSTGAITFRKTAFELLAAYGWNNGFLPYVSDEYKKPAQDEGKVFGDQYIFNKVFKGKYPNYAAFKKDMFNQRIAKKDLIKPVTINFNRKTVKINTFDDLSNVMDEAVNLDLQRLQHGSSQRYVDQLKHAILAAYSAKTNDFTSSIFKTPTYSKFQVRFVDTDSHAPQDLSSKTLTLNGVFGTTIDGDQVNQVITNLEHQGYQLIRNNFADAGNQFSSTNNGQTYTVQLGHLTTVVNADSPKTTTDVLPDNAKLHYPADVSANNLKKTVQRTITITEPSNHTQAINQAVNFTRQATVDEVTGQLLNYSNWQTTDQTNFPAITLPTFAGYTASLAEIPAWSATPNDESQNLTITYSKNESPHQSQTGQALTQPTNPAYDLTQLQHSATGDALIESNKPSYDLSKLQSQENSGQSTELTSQSATGQPLTQPTNPAYNLDQLKHSETDQALTEPDKPTYDLSQLQSQNQSGQSTELIHQSATAEPLTQPTNPAFDLNQLKHSETAEPITQPTNPSFNLDQLKYSQTGEALTEPLQPTFDLNHLINQTRQLSTEQLANTAETKQVAASTSFDENVKPSVQFTELNQKQHQADNRASSSEQPKLPQTGNHRNLFAIFGLGLISSLTAFLGSKKRHFG